MHLCLTLDVFYELLELSNVHMGVERLSKLGRRDSGNLIRATIPLVLIGLEFKHTQ